MMQDRECALGWDAKSSKRSSGLFSVLKWFGNKESVSAPSPDLVNSASSSCDSIESVFSTDTVASFAFVPPNSYKPFGTAQQAEKFILSGPETSTYRARLAQREASRESDRNLTLRSKYNLYKGPESDRGHSLPLMSKTIIVEQRGMHRRTASESSKHRRAGAYCHVKGKRKAPQPPGSKGENTLRRKKRMAPQPPTIICNDSLKLDHGILKPAKEPLEATKKIVQIQEVHVSPRPWYKRTLSKSSTPEKKVEQEKRKSGLSFLTNISELDREAMEIVGKENLKMKYLKSLNQAPPFMRPKGSEHVRTNSDSWITPKRKSARDLIAKFNAITGVTRSTSQEPKETIIPIVREEHQSTSSEPKKETTNFQPTKNTAVVKPISRSQWNCPKCTLENDYWRIICKVCSTIKPYFDDFTSISSASSPLTEIKAHSENPKIEKTLKTDPSDLFGLDSVENRIIDLQRTVLNSNYPKLSQNFDKKLINDTDAMKFISIQPSGLKLSKDSENNLSTNANENKNEIKEESKFDKQNLFQHPKVNLKSVKNNNKEEDEQKIEKKILGDELGFNGLNQNEKQINNSAEEKNMKVEEKIILGDEISFEKPDYVNINKYELIDSNKNKVEKMILGDELHTQNTSQNLKKTQPAKVLIHNITNENDIKNDELKPKQNDDNNKADIEKKREHEKLKKMLIEMKNSLPKRIKTPDNKNIKHHRVSLIEEQPEPEKEEELPEKTAELIIATTETIYENIKIKRPNVEKPVKVSSSAQTQSVLRRSLSQEERSAIEDSKTGFHLIGAKDFVGISNEKTGNSDESHTYANLNTSEINTFPGCSKTDTLEINRLLRRLETSIAGGELGQAAVFARELAQLKVPLSVIRQKTEEADPQKKKYFDIEMYVEDKISHRGPFPLSVTEKMTVVELKKLVEEKYKIPIGVQRWILGKQLATDDNAALITHQITSPGCPVFLYLVAPAIEPKSETAVEIVELSDLEPPRPAPPSNIIYNVPIAIIEEDIEDADTENEEENDDDIGAIGFELDSNVQELWKCRACTLLNPISSKSCDVCGLIKDEEESDSKETYLQLVNLDNEDLVRNTQAFECLVCLAECPKGDGVTLRECLHQFCRVCLAHTIEFSEEAEVKCPYRDEQYSCDIALQDREVKALVSAVVYEQHLAKSVKQAENKMDNTFHCKTPDCTGWCIFEDNVNEFHCPVCRNNNCLTCQAIHVGLNCKQYQEHMKSSSETDEDARRTRDFLEDMITRGEALACPTCQVVLLKKWGCDWLRCSMCKTEICWVTRGPRWGPGGKGDTTAGCKCGVNGIKCHPKCNYCH